MFELKGYKAKHLVRVFPSKGWNKAMSTSCCKSYGLLGQLTIILAVADDAVPAQLMTLILLANGITQKWLNEK